MKDTSDKCYFKAYMRLYSVETAPESEKEYSRFHTTWNELDSRRGPTAERLNFCRLSYAVDYLGFPWATGVPVAAAVLFA